MLDQLAEILCQSAIVAKFHCPDLRQSG
jgi:hypothetical protein